ncbi:hypothetical protein PI124_g14918 [Phytophthora idaei]|nr:hypothetical protein PI125_g18554 [Phytophthora idaei]KAG3142824.1 hypothetical protein PI126_g14884 [Phytophthora idaei]KAG3240176.1 hypothetical protein PI124_g14918 [Phytophthora idaei]
MDRGRLIICGDSSLLIRQMRGEIECKAPGLTPLRKRALDRLRSWPTHELLHVKRSWNQSADRLASTALQQQKGTTVTSEVDWEDLITLNRLPELLLPKDEEPIARVVAATRSRSRWKDAPEVLQSDVVQRVRTDRIQQAQNEEKWIADLKAYLSGELDKLDANEAQMCGKTADEYEVDKSGLLLYCPRAKKTDGERDLIVKLVVPEELQQDVLHRYHSSLEGGHQGIGRTCQRIRSRFP